LRRGKLANVLAERRAVIAERLSHKSRHMDLPETLKR
jgi:hypothetical protein